MTGYFRSSVFVFLFVAFLLCSHAANALEPQKNTATLAPEVSYYDFKQTGMESDGFLYGLSGSFTYRGEILNERLPKAMLKADGRIIFGHLNFNGELFDNRTYEIKQVRNYLAEGRTLAGYDFPIFSQTTITPFAGMGYRFLSAQLEKNDAGYQRNSSYLYSPIGFETNTPLSNGWSVGVNAEYDIFWHGWQDTNLSDLDPLFSDVSNDQDSGYGFKASIKFRKAASDKNFIFEPYVDYWDIDSSDTQQVYHSGVYGGRTYQEPQNTTTMVGIKVGVEF